MDETTATPSIYAPADAPAWRLDWLSPIRCRLILALFLALTFLGNLYYLHHSPLDLGGDEAQYWDWSRNLDLSYYSKGPGIAYIIRASCAMFGETMQAVRYPAILISSLTSLTVYLLTRKLFGSDRLALGTVLLFAITPLIIVGSILITIDPPMFLCWGLGTYFAVMAIFENRRWAWIAVGVMIALGFLAKYVTLVWFIGLFVFLLTSEHRAKLKGACVALAIALIGTIPVLVWNAQHNWVSFRHVAHQTGTTGGAFYPLGPLEFLGGQAGALGPAIAWMMLIAVWSVRKSDDPRLRFLVWIGLPMFLITLIGSLRTKIQLNWPAPAYFTLLIVTGHFLATRLQSVQTWKPWRGWVCGAVATGLIVIPMTRDTAFFLPIFEKAVKMVRKDADDVDPLARLRGWKLLGQKISQELKLLPTGSFVLCDDYQQTAETAFYVEGQPKTYCGGFYYGKRMSQYDIWKDRRLDSTSLLIGRDALFIGKGGGIQGPVREAFERVERLPLLDVEVNGVVVRRFTIWRAYGFKGFALPAGAVDY